VKLTIHIHLLSMCETTHPRHHRSALDKALRNLTNFHTAAAWMCDWLEHWPLAVEWYRWDRVTDLDCLRSETGRQQGKIQNETRGISRRM